MLLTTGTLRAKRKIYPSRTSRRNPGWRLAYLYSFGSIIAFTAYNWLLEHYSPTLVATHTYVNPIVAVLLGWLYAGETITLKVGIRGRAGGGSGGAGGSRHQQAAAPRLTTSACRDRARLFLAPRQSLW